MIRRPPRSTRTVTHLPNTTLDRTLNSNELQQGVRELDHALAERQVDPPRVSAIADRGAGGESSPMTALDEQFVAIAEANPGLRVRVGNPDELRSNKLDRTLDRKSTRLNSSH